MKHPGQTKFQGLLTFQNCLQLKILFGLGRDPGLDRRGSHKHDWPFFFVIEARLFYFSKLTMVMSTNPLASLAATGLFLLG